MRIRILQHTSETPPGSVLQWLEAKRAPYRIDKLFEGEPLPASDDVDWLISLGGAMNCDEDARYPFLAEEKKLLAEMVEKRKAVLGLCLGGQLLARALGASVRQHEGWEVGWHSLQVSSGERLVAFQWHQDTFDLPTGSRRIATNAFCPNQGFVFGSTAVGLQFHPEATEEWIKACVEDADYPAGPFVQAREKVMDEIGFLAPMRKWFFSLMDQMERVAKASSASSR